MAVMAARLLGAARVFAVDMVKSRLEMAERLGAIPIDGSAGSSSDAVKAATGGPGADRPIEAGGPAAALRTAHHPVRPAGRVSPPARPTPRVCGRPLLDGSVG